MKLDLHVHTRRHSPDSTIEPDELARAAASAGLHGVVLTEHDWLWTESEIDALSSDGFCFVRGVEVSCREGHFLAYGVTDPFRLPRGMHVAVMCEEVHRQGGVVIAAHPFRWKQDFENVLRLGADSIDGIEVASFNMDAEMEAKAREVASRLRIAEVASSDAHASTTLGFAHTEVAGDIRSTTDLVEAIRARATRGVRALKPFATPL